MLLKPLDYRLGPMTNQKLAKQPMAIRLNTVNAEPTGTSSLQTTVPLDQSEVCKTTKGNPIKKR
jgi:hypothetical protein